VARSRVVGRRAVPFLPPTDSDSNYRAALETWLAKVSPPGSSQQGELPPGRPADAYDAELARAARRCALAVALLGVGPVGTGVAVSLSGHR